MECSLLQEEATELIKSDIDLIEIHESRWQGQGRIVGIKVQFFLDYTLHGKFNRALN